MAPAPSSSASCLLTNRLLTATPVLSTAKKKAHLPGCLRPHSATLTLSPLVSTPPLAFQSFFPGSSLSSDSSPLLCVLWTQPRPSFPFTVKPAGSIAWAFSSGRHHCLPPSWGVWGLGDLIVASLSSVTSLHSPPVCTLPAASPQLPAPRGQLLTYTWEGREGSQRKQK